jgi:site-specific recombinase XerD
MSEKELSPKVRPSSLTKYDVAFFIYDKGSARWSHLLKEFVENQSERHISRQKLSDYLKELCDEGLVQKTIDKKALALRMLWRVYPVYVVPKNRKKRIEEIRNKREIYDFVDSASPERIKKLHEEIKHLRETEDER